MTNEVASATNSVCSEFLQPFAQGQEVWDQVIAWVTEKGLSFAASLIASALIFVIGTFIIKAIVAAINRMITKKGKANVLMANFLCNVISKVCWTVLVVIILGKLGVNIGPIIAGLGVTGFILGFAFQETLGNFASGLMIAINEPFKIGDYVTVAGLEGSVRKISMMATELATADNKKVVIPNKSAWGSPITNYTALETRRVDLKIGIDYSCDIAKAIKIAMETLPCVPGVLTMPAPSVTVASLDDSQITLNVRPWVKTADYWTVYNDTFTAMKVAFEQNGIDIPFPQLTVHMDK